MNYTIEYTRKDDRDAPMKACPRYFSFQGLRLQKVVAHGGVGEILTSRVQERDAAMNFLDLTVIPPGCSIGVHRHSDDTEEIYVFISGRGAMFHMGRWFEVGPGDVVVNPPGGEHGFSNTGDGDVRLVVIEFPCEAGKGANEIVDGLSLVPLAALLLREEFER